MQLRYFEREEFDSPDAPGSGRFMDPQFLQMLDACRDMAKIPFRINSGFRTEAHNKKVGGVPKSSHLKGLAADIACDWSGDRAIIVGALIRGGFTRIGIHEKFVHVDMDRSKPAPRIWLYA